MSDDRFSSPESTFPARDVGDATLLQRFQSGDGDAATAIYTRYASRLISLANRNSAEALATRVDPEDIVQSIFRTFFRRASEGHYQVPQGDELWKLLLIIALNKVRSIAEYHRAAKRDVGQTQSLGALDVEGMVNAEAILRLTVEEALASLPPVHQRVIRDRIDGHEIKEIAARNGSSRRTVERILQSFRLRLGKSLQLP